MTDQESESARERAPIERQEHSGLFDKQVSVRDFNALAEYLGAHTLGQIVQLFEGRATYNIVQDWRRSRARIPKWAWEYLAALIDARAAQARSMAELARTKPGINGRGTHRNICAWNARRAKEKARS